MAKKETFNLQEHYLETLAPLWRKAPFVLRITTWKAVQGPVLVVKEFREYTDKTNDAQPLLNLPDIGKKGSFVERGHLSGESLRRCLPILRKVVEGVSDKAGIPLDIHRCLTPEGLRMQANLPLNDDSGAKLALLFRLQERISDLNRVELIALRIARFTREEALYWHSRTTTFGLDANRWAIAGLRILLGGQSQDPAVEVMLARLRRGG
ncbi:MAG: DUF7680 family protein [Syntrophales bacterium]